MSRTTFVKRSRLNAPAESVFRWHARPGALERLTPPWTTVEVVERSGGIEDGARVVMRVPAGLSRVRWVAEHRDYVDGVQFRDVQVEGPFAVWEHTHRVDPDGARACYLEDRVEYELPFGAAGALFGGRVYHMLERMFTYRHRLIAQDLATHSAYHNGALRVLISGSTGLVGSALVTFLTTGGHQVTRLVRKPHQDAASIRWDPASGSLDVGALGEFDAVVHLAGENIASGRWTDATKARIMESRRQGTRLLAESLARAQPRPRVLVSASAIGFYGDRGAELLQEDSAAGTGFLAEVCREWEAATAPAAESGMRVVNLRIGIVLTAAGGVLATLLPPFRIGAGGRVGDGKHYMSWVALDDLLGIILHAIRTEGLRGPVNATAPTPVTNQEFTKTLGRVLGRPTILPLPPAVARLAFGEMADELLLASTRVEPVRLEATRYAFRFAELEGALRHTVGR